jgi:hypothetical protein
MSAAFSVYVKALRCDNKFCAVFPVIGRVHFLYGGFHILSLVVITIRMLWNMQVIGLEGIKRIMLDNIVYKIYNVDR